MRDTGVINDIERDTDDTKDDESNIEDYTSDLEEELEGAEGNTMRYKLKPNITIYRPMPGVAEQPTLRDTRPRTQHFGGFHCPPPVAREVHLAIYLRLR